MAKKQSNATIFVICLFVAGLFWLASNMAKTYERDYSVPLQFVNAPASKTANSSVNQLVVALDASGWELLFNNFNSRIIEVSLNDYELEKINVLNSRELVNKVFIEGSVNGVVPGTFSVELVDLSGKWIPIYPKYDTDLKNSHFVTGEIELSVDSIFISGSEDTLKMIDSIFTEIFTINKEVYQNEKVGLVIPDQVEASQDFISVKAQTEEYTEQEFLLSVEPINVPEGLDYMFYPEEVAITCLVPFSMYEETKTDNFDCTLDFSEKEMSKSGLVQPKISKAPIYVKYTQINPEVVNLIIYR